MNPKEYAQMMIREGKATEGLRIAQESVKTLKAVSLGDLPNFDKIAADVLLPDRTIKNLKARAKVQDVEVRETLGFWVSVEGILKKVAK